MSEPIQLDKNYGKIPENAEPGITLPEYASYIFNQIAFALEKREWQNEKTDAGTYYFEDRLGGNPVKDSYCAIPIKDDNNAVKGWLVSDLKDKKGHLLWAPSANLIILKSDDGRRSQIFFTEYGKSFSKKKISGKHLKYSDIERCKNAAFEKDSDVLYSSKDLFSFFSSRLAKLGEDRNLNRLRKLLTYCADSPIRKSAMERLQKILPGLITSYERSTDPKDKQRLILLKAIYQQVCCRLDPELLWCRKRKVTGKLAYGTPLESLDFYGYGINNSILAINQIREKLENKGCPSNEASAVLKAIDFYEWVLVAIYAKYAKDPKKELQTNDVTCFEIATHKMKLAVINYLKKTLKEEILIVQDTGLPPFNVDFAEDPFKQIAYRYPSIYSQHLVGAKKHNADDEMYRWALQHAEKMGVPVGAYDKLKEDQYDALNEAAGLDDPTEKLDKLEKTKRLKDSTSGKTSRKKSAGTSDQDNNDGRTQPDKKRRRKQRNDRIPGLEIPFESNIDREEDIKSRVQIQAEYLSTHSSSIKYVPLTAEREGACSVPNDDILLEMANEAYWQSGHGKRLINAINRGENERTYAVEYLIYKLKIKGYNKDDVEASIQMLQKRKISSADLQKLDRPSMAKVILAAKKCGISIPNNCQTHLARVLQRPHMPSLLF